MENEAPIEKRFMEDLKGEFQEEFTLLLEHLQRTNLTQYVETIESIFKMFSVRCTDINFAMKVHVRKPEFEDFYREIDKYWKVAKSMPCTLAEIYDKHTAILRIQALHRELSDMISVEQRLEVMTNLGTLKNKKFV